ncbi:hypothetical protein 8G_00046 [Ralstonia phage Hyacinthe]|uniref:Uncharacterized protein n=3 Tax=Rahariannevirus raharianne TaxID=2846050 RepID=A0A7G5BBG1_9CAUD|nr:hypothetical protein KMC43_gp65 [Ralstonia phage Raharianne]QMV32440.1 hypothetical protein U2_00065 [Ralstonia phage Albius]QMV33478.1 hypothetical protein 8G_00046 [Ralstonia phage Hyacinthe]QMV33634.1 hypothetical protein Y2_00065 [Ralstonia phage Raharianne]
MKNFNAAGLMARNEQVWIVKYALNAGPRKVEAEIEGSKAILPDKFPAFFYGEGKEWCRTREQALARCEALRCAKLKSLERSASKLQKIDFDKLLEDE